MEIKNLSVIIILNFLIFVTLLFSSCTNKRVKEEPDVYYTCSMDPQVMEKKPGKCPICKMELTRTVVSSEQDKESVKLSDTQIKLGNIVTQKIERTSIGEGIQLRGTIVQDERTSDVISSRAPGRIEKLYFKNQGELIHKGDKVYDIYSEELQAAIKQYLLLKVKAKELNNNSVNYHQMLKSAKDKLLVWGMSDAQIDDLKEHDTNSLISFYSKVKGIVGTVKITEGDYVNEGSPILEVSDFEALWVEAEAYPQHLKVIESGLKVKMTVEAYPDEVKEGHISFANPQLKDQTRITILRIEISNKSGKYKPGMRVTVTAVLKEINALAVPEQAILFQPELNRVWVMKGQNSFVPRRVETGMTSNGNIEIRSGLKEGDLVVVAGAYLIESEYQLRKGAGGMVEMDRVNSAGHNTSVTSGHQH